MMTKDNRNAKILGVVFLFGVICFLVFLVFLVKYDKEEKLRIKEDKERAIKMLEQNMSLYVNSTFFTGNGAKLKKLTRYEICWGEWERYTKNNPTCDLSIPNDCEFKQLNAKVLGLEARTCEGRINDIQ